MSSTPQQPPPGWYPDPAGSDGERFWDGIAWSQSTRDKPRPEPAPPPYNDYGAQPSGYGVPGGYSAPGMAGLRPAGFWWRAVAYVVDVILLGFLGLVVWMLTGRWDRVMLGWERWLRDAMIALDNPGAAMPPMPAELESEVGLLGWAIVGLTFLYRTALYLTKSATLGQLMCGLRLVPADGGPDARVSQVQGVIRAAVSALLWAFLITSIINAVSMLFNKRKQTISDLIAKTQVLKIR